MRSIRMHGLKSGRLFRGLGLPVIGTRSQNRITLIFMFNYNSTFKKRPLIWQKNRTLYISITFTWDLPKIKAKLEQRSLFWEKVVVGGPAVRLIPDYFQNMPFVTVGGAGSEIKTPVLQKICPFATRSSIGCFRKCGFCAVDKIAGRLIEFDDWPDLPILIDDNLLATSQPHFDRVIDRLIVWGWADFNQGLDARLLNSYHAKRFKQIKRPMLRLVLDDMKVADDWLAAIETLQRAGIPKYFIRSYALIAFNTDPAEAWKRCEFIEKNGIKPMPAFYHRLDELKKNNINDDQRRLGWNNYERRRIMQWFYQHKKAKKTAADTMGRTAIV